jgi:hypothetical protein
MLMEAKIANDTLVLLDENHEVALSLPLLALQNFNPGICATQLLSQLLTDDRYAPMEPVELAGLAAEMAKKIRDVLQEE